MAELRMHFTTDDLTRTRILTSPHPMWELVLSVAVVGARQAPPSYLPWRAWAIDRLNQVPDRRNAELLAALVPPKGDFPDFLTPCPAAEGFAATLDTVLSTPAARIRAELARCGGGTRPMRELRRLADGDRESLHLLSDAASWYYRTVLEPFWPSVYRAVCADRDVRVRDLTTDGLNRMLSSMPPCINWTPPTLRAAYPVNRDIHLGGRGLTLIPSYFCWGTPVALIDTELPPVLVYPLDYPLDGPLTQADDPSRLALSRLIGGTRAQVLQSLDVPRTTTGLAQHLRISPASASKHATALREAGLVTSVRRGNTMIHTTTPLGTSLLNETSSELPGRDPTSDVRIPL